MTDENDEINGSAVDAQGHAIPQDVDAVKNHPYPRSIVPPLSEARLKALEKARANRGKAKRQLIEREDQLKKAQETISKLERDLKYEQLRQEDLRLLLTASKSPAKRKKSDEQIEAYAAQQEVKQRKKVKKASPAAQFKPPTPSIYDDIF